MSGLRRNYDTGWAILISLIWVAHMRVLVVDDNRDLVAMLFEYMEAKGHTLDAAPDGYTGKHLAMSQSYDAIVLDWMLPRLEGPEVLRQLRTEGCDTPILMLTAKDDLPDKITGFRSGADDYLTKPFDLPELEVRLDALVIRARGRWQRKTLQVADLKYDLTTYEATRGERALHLYPAGRKLLEVLMLASPAVVTRARLEQALWGDEPPDGDMLRSHIYELRRSVDGGHAQKLIHTLPRVGYRLADTRIPPETGDHIDG